MRSKLPALAIAVAILASGCAPTSRVSVSGANSSAAPPVPTPGSSYGMASVRADINPGTWFGLALFGFLAAGAEQSSWRSTSRAWRAPPELAEDRSIAERDCSQPMERPYANLRCR